MGIESYDYVFGFPTGVEACKKSPQTWGLKVDLLYDAFKTVLFLQKESPDMGIESRKEAEAK